VLKRIALPRQPAVKGRGHAIETLEQLAAAKRGEIGRRAFDECQGIDPTGVGIEPDCAAPG